MAFNHNFYEPIPSFLLATQHSRALQDGMERSDSSRISCPQQASARQPKYSYLVTSARAAPAPYRDSSYNTEQRKAVTSYPTTSSYQVTGAGATLCSLPALFW